MKPVQDMRGLWAHLPLQCPQRVIAIREKGDLLVHLYVLRVQHLIQTPLGLGIQRLDKPKALERGRPVLYTLSKAQHTLADNDLEVMLLVPPMAHVAPVNAHCERAIRQRQELPRTGITLDKTRLFLTQLRFQSLGDLEGVVAHGFDVQAEIKWQEVLEGIQAHTIGHQRGPLGFHIEPMVLVSDKPSNDISI